VWAVERRENLLEDHSVLDRAKAGQATVQQVFDYYLGWLADSSITPHVRLIPDAEVGYARRWGMRTEIGDLRRVVLRAKRRGGKVVVGGHSLGGTITSAYATWDFGGRPGARGLAGLVFIDGASRPQPIAASDARARLADLGKGSPWLNFGGISAPFAGIFNSTGSLAVELAPDEPSSGQVSGLLPPTSCRRCGSPTPGSTATRSTRRRRRTRSPPRRRTSAGWPPPATRAAGTTPTR
jgi:pimeloyl-ACP methyl ester carboxylesterase